MRAFTRLFTAALLVGGVSGCAADDDASVSTSTEEVKTELAPNGRGTMPKGFENAHGDASPGQAYRRGNGISYHGGPVIHGTTNVYYIWYGDWASQNAGANALLTNLAQHIGGSGYFNINTTYYSGSVTHSYVSNSVNYAGSTTDSYSKGKTLSDQNIQDIVAAAISGGRLPKDTNAVYFVLTTPDVTESSGFCTQYCGWHTHGTISGSDIKYAFIGDPETQCPSGCEEQTASSPNNNPGADGMASIISHELEEAVSDPDLNAWYDSTGQENADKCAWTFGTTYHASNGSLYNQVWGGVQYLIQRNWVNASGGFCATSY
jgi:hypothetical protein